MVSRADSAATGGGSRVDKLIRHALFDRLLHWVTAGCVIVLLATAFLPILGFDFAWVTIHWVTGIVVTVTVSIHIVRALFWRDLQAMRIGPRDLREGLQLAKWMLRLDTGRPGLTGKYSLAQKAIHHIFSMVVLTTIVSGALMLKKIDTPWWERDPYWLGENVWGAIYVLHDFAALLLIAMVMMHVYFALRPEKLFFTRAMILGWITRDEHEAHHDPERWRADPE